MSSNLPGDRRRALDALLTHAIRAYDFLDLESPNQLPLDVWTEARDDVSDAFNGKCTSIELAALADGCQRYSVPTQYLFDMYDGADWWTRAQKLDSFDELTVMAYRLGGTLVAASNGTGRFRRTICRRSSGRKPRSRCRSSPSAAPIDTAQEWSRCCGNSRAMSRAAASRIAIIGCPRSVPPRRRPPCWNSWSADRRGQSAVRRAASTRVTA